MGALRQPVAGQPVTTYGIGDDVFGEQARRPLLTSRVVLLVLSVSLVVMTLWFVGRPVLAAPSTAQRSCERVVVDNAGAATCVTGNDRVVRVG
jgi:hypothetical protein